MLAADHVEIDTSLIADYTKFYISAHSGVLLEHSFPQAFRIIIIIKVIVKFVTTISCSSQANPRDTIESLC